MNKFISDVLDYIRHRKLMLFFFSPVLLIATAAEIGWDIDEKFLE